MFNLEEKISEWRRGMLAAGIKTPVPLEELEIHLREDIEQQIKSGLNEPEAFSFAVQKIGQPRLLKTEFKKAGCIGTFMKTKLTFIIGTSFGLVVGLIMFLVGLSLRHQAGSVLMTPYLTLNTPALWLLVRLHSVFYNWESFAGFSQVLAAFLIYWVLLGNLAGLGLRAFWNRKHGTNAT